MWRDKAPLFPDILAVTDLILALFRRK